MNVLKAQALAQAVELVLFLRWFSL